MVFSKKTNQGFGVIEVLVSMSIMTLVILALFSISSTTFLNWDLAKNKTIAQGILQSVLEDIHNKRDANVLGGGSTIVWNNGIADSSKEFTVNDKKFTADISIDPVNTGLPSGIPNDSIQKVEVTVSWVGRGSLGTQSIKSITYITDWRPKY